MSFRVRLLCFVGLPVVAVFILLITLETIALRDSASAKAIERASLLAQQTAQLIDSELSTAAGAADTLADVISKGDVDWAAMPALSRDLIKRLDLVVGIVTAFDTGGVPSGLPQAEYVFRRDGAFVVEDIGASHDIAADSPWYIQDLELGPGRWTDPFYGEVIGMDIVSYTTRFHTTQGVSGFVVVDVGLEALFGQLDVGGFKDVVPSLRTADGTHIDMPMGDRTTQARAAEPKIMRTALLPTLGWSFEVAIGSSEVFERVDEQLLLNGILLTSGAAMVVGILMLAGLRMSRRLKTLSAGVAKVSEGDLDATVEHLGADEIGRLAVGFNSMTSKLRDTVQQIARETARLHAMERELEVAREIQQSMLPGAVGAVGAVLDRQEVDLHALLQPADHVAGDFYDWWLQGDTLTVLVADVSGHGIGPALVMAMARRTLRDAAAVGHDMASMIAAADEAIADNNPRQMFITAVIAQVDLATGAYAIINAGHPEALLVSADGVTFEGKPTGPLLGIMPDPAWTLRHGTLEPGDALVLYTDGLIEAMNEAGELLGMEGLRRALRSTDAPSLCQSAIDTAVAFQDGPAKDDLTVLAIRWAGPCSI